MSLRNASPVHFSPVGLSDALDATNVFPGAMQSLQNLIPDPTTKNVWTCRPAAEVETIFSAGVGGFPDAGFVSCQIVLGSLAYGLIASSANTGHDQPFCYDIANGVFITITGATASNTPVSPTTTGDWTPPTMALVGSKLLVTHPGFTGAAAVYFGWFDLSVPGSPTWDGGNTATNALPNVPTAVFNFSGRAYYIVPVPGQPALYFSDVLMPLTITTGTNILTFDDNLPLIALGGLPLNNQLGGIIQSLIVFKENNCYQVTGDAALASNPLTKNALNIAVGTLSPRCVTETPKGLAFLANDGIRVIDFKANVSDPIGFAGMGVTVPFIHIANPSRACAACNANVFRISVTQGIPTGTVNQEYWYDIGRACFSGPHTFPAATISIYSNDFIMTPIGVTATLFRSNAVQTKDSVFIENGFQLSFDFRPAILPDVQTMSALNILETTINIAGSTDAVTYQAQFITANGAVLDTVSLAVSATASRWGAFTWGGAVWSVSITGLTPLPINWHRPIVFRKGTIDFSGFSYLGFKIGDLFMRYEQLGYLQQVA